MKAEAPERTWIRLTNLLRPHGFAILFSLATSSVGGAAVLCIGAGVRAFVDHGLRGGDPRLLLGAALVLLALVVVYGAAAYSRARVLGAVGERITADLRTRVLARLLAHGPGFFDTRPPGEVSARLMSDTATIPVLVEALLSALRNTIVIGGGLLAMFRTSVSLSLLAVVLMPLSAYPVSRVGRRVRASSQVAQQASARASSFAMESIDGIRAVKSDAQESRILRRFAELAEASLEAANRRNRDQGLASASSVWLVYGCVVFLIWSAGHRVVQGRMTEGGASAFLFYTAAVAASAASSAGVFAGWQRAVGALDSLDQLARDEPVVKAPAIPRPLPRPVRGEIVFDAVSFAYPARPDHPVLSSVSFAVQPGRTTALVGPSGAGKSTLLALLLRFYDPAGGCVRLDGIDLRDLDPPDFRACFSLVPQEPAIFDGSIRDNIAFGRADATLAEVEAAADAAYATEFTRRLPLGLDTQVGARGVQLSGGQKQRIAIARAVLRDPAVLLLDEATNALDARSEALVRKALDALTAQRTTVVIAHRLSTVQHADEILVLDEGRIVERGDHISLSRSGNLYTRMLRLQFASSDATRDDLSPPTRFAQQV